MRALGEWVDLGHGHSMKFVVVRDEVIGGVLRHPVLGTYAEHATNTYCEDGLVQWEPNGSSTRPIFTLESSPGRPVSLSPFIVCSICGDKGWIVAGKWHPKDDEEGLGTEPSMPVIEGEGDYVHFAIRRDLGDKVPEEERDADRRLVDMTGRSGDLVLPNDDAVAEAEEQERERAGFEEGESEGEWAAAPPGEPGPFDSGLEVEVPESAFGHIGDVHEIPSGAHTHPVEKVAGRVPMTHEHLEEIAEQRRALERAADPDAALHVNEHGGRQSDLGVRFDLIDGKALAEMAAVLDYGAKKYGEDNWRAISVEEHLNHAITHAYAWLAGDKSDDHLSHFFTRAMFAEAVEIQGGPDPSYGTG